MVFSCTESSGRLTGRRTVYFMPYGTPYPWLGLDYLAVGIRVVRQVEVGYMRSSLGLHHFCHETGRPARGQREPGDLLALAA